MKIDEFNRHIRDTQDEPVRIFVCHGPPRCPGRVEPCPWCKVTYSDDQRPTEEILESMKPDN